MLLGSDAFIALYNHTVDLEIEFQIKVTAEGGATATKNAKLTINICGDETITRSTYDDESYDDNSFEGDNTGL